MMVFPYERCDCDIFMKGGSSLNRAIRRRPYGNVSVTGLDHPEFQKIMEMNDPIDPLLGVCDDQRGN
jgi:hypothetical protein